MPPLVAAPLFDPADPPDTAPAAAPAAGEETLVVELGRQRDAAFPAAFGAGALVNDGRQDVWDDVQHVLDPERSRDVHTRSSRALRGRSTGAGSSPMLPYDAARAATAGG